MSIDLSTYERGYYGYLNDSVREALGALQDSGGVRAVVDGAVAMNALEDPKDKDLVVDLVEQQLYAYSESAGEWIAIGASQTVPHGEGGVGLAR